MKQAVKSRARRDLFSELNQGMDALEQARCGKRTLLSHTVEFRPAPKVTPCQPGDQGVATS